MNCNYSFSQLKPVFWLVDEDKIDYFDYEVVLTDAERHDCLSVSFSGQSVLDERYTFNKGITITLQGYQPDLVLDGKRIAVETVSGEVFLVNWEFDVDPIYKFSEWDTTYNLELPENLPILPCTLVSSSAGTSYNPCEYTLPEATEIALVRHDECAYFSGTVDLYDTDKIVFDGLKDLALTESFDGYKYQQTIQFSLPLNADTDVESYKLQEFQNNKYIAVVGDRFVCGIEFGMDVQTTISSGDENGSITLQLVGDENINLAEETSGLTYDDSDQIEWRYQLKTQDGLYCWVCDGLEPNPTGNAQYILQCGYYPNGVFADKYKEQREFQGWYPQIQDKVVGTFNDIVTFYKDSCYLDDTLRINSLQSPLYFYVVGKRWSFEVDSQWSNWVATTVPSFVELSQERGTSGRTVVTMTCTGSTSQQGTLVIRNAKYAQSFAIIADYSLPVIVQSNEISYSAQTKSYFCREQVILLERSASNGFTPQVMIAGKKVTIVYPENASENDVTYSFRFQGVKSKKEQTVVITQHPRS